MIERAIQGEQKSREGEKVSGYLHVVARQYPQSRLCF